MADRIIMGTFHDYALDLDQADFPEDEDAVASACEEMFSMCGNAGQETLIADQLEVFTDWGIQALEEEMAYGTAWGDFVLLVVEEWYEGRVDKWQGTRDIWAVGWRMVAEQSGYHDSQDEQGEGTGGEFS